MKNFLLMILIFCVNNALGEWIYYGQNEFGDLLWYEEESVQKKGDQAFVWIKNRYSPPNNYGYLSSRVHVKVNCSEYNFQFLEILDYRQENWTGEGTYRGKIIPHSIPPNSSIASLANIVCAR